MVLGVTLEVLVGGASAKFEIVGDSFEVVERWGDLTRSLLKASAFASAFSVNVESLIASNNVHALQKGVASENVLDGVATYYRSKCARVYHLADTCPRTRRCKYPIVPLQGPIPINQICMTCLRAHIFRDRRESY